MRESCVNNNAKKTFKFKNGRTVNQFFYTKECGSFCYYGVSGTVEFMCDRVAIAFDSKCNTLLKHGTVNDIRLWFALALERYRRVGLNEIADDLIIIESKEWDLDELNWLIACTGSIGTFIEKYGLRT